MNIMEVTKRNGKTQELLIDKITKRIQYLCTNEEKKKLDIHHIVIKTCSDIYNKIKTSELDTLTANICCLLYKSQSPRHGLQYRMRSSD